MEDSSPAEHTITIAVVHEIFLPVVNGVVTSSIEIAHALRQRGHRVVFIAPAWRRFRSPEVEGIPVYYIPSIPSPIYPGLRIVRPCSGRLRKIFEDERVEAVQLTGQWLLSRAAMGAARRLGIPVVHSFHTLIYRDRYLLYLCKSRVALPLLRRLVWSYIRPFVEHSDLTTAPGTVVVRTLQSRFPRARIVHLPNGIGIDSALLRRSPPGHDGKYFLFVGRLGDEKSVGTLLEAFAEARRQDPGLKLLLAGDGPARRGYERLVQSLQIEDAVSFLGRIPHRHLMHSGLYPEARALVTAAETENQPMSILEAMACGTPVIAPAIESMEELTDGSGRLFPAGDSTAMAAEMVRLAHDDRLRADCSRRAAERARRFEAEKIARLHERVFMEAGCYRRGRDACVREQKTAQPPAGQSGTNSTDFR